MTAADQPTTEPSEDEVVEAVAKALADDWNPDRDPVLTAMFRDYAQTAVTAAAGLFAPQPAADAEVTRLNAVLTAVREKRTAWAAEDPATWDYLHVTAASAFRAAQYAIVHDLDEALGDLPHALDGGA